MIASGSPIGKVSTPPVDHVAAHTSAVTDSALRFPARFPKLSPLPVLLTLCYLAYSIWFIIKTSFVFDGVRYFVLFDDMMIGMRFARNLVRHGQLVWNLSERVEGFTNPLWVLYFAFLHLFNIPEAKISLLVQLTGMLLILVTAWFTYRLAHELTGGSRYASLAAATFTLFYFPLLNWSLQGCEVSLLALLLTWALWEMVRARQVDAMFRRPYLLLGLAVCTRVDSIIPFLAVLLYAAMVDRKRLRSHVTFGASVLVLIMGVQTLVRWFYYGELLPNTYYQKLSGTPLTLRLENGLLGLARFVLQISPILLLLAAVSLFARRRRPVMALLATIIACQLVYSIWVGGDAWEQFGGTNRYVSIAMPLFFVVLGYSIGSLAEIVRRMLAGTDYWKQRWLLLWKLSAVVAALVVLNVGNTADFAKRLVMRSPLPDVPELQHHAAMGLFLPRFTHPDAKIAVAWAGALPYFSNRPSVDFLGKCDKVIARLPAKYVPGRIMYPGHMKWDYQYSITRYSPDVIVELWKSADQAEPVLSERYDEVKLGGFDLRVLKTSDKIDWRELALLSSSYSASIPGFKGLAGDN
jgi:hypothetical protein